MSNQTRQRFTEGLQELLKFDEELQQAADESEDSKQGNDETQRNAYLDRTESSMERDR